MHLKHCAKIPTTGGRNKNPIGEFVSFKLNFLIKMRLFFNDVVLKVFILAFI